MAATKYEVLCRYYNLDMKMPITNIVNETWVSYFDKDKVNKTTGYYIDEVFEFFIKKEISAEDAKGMSTQQKEQLQKTYDKENAIQERKIQDLLIYGNNSANPKFNMFFIYKSRDFIYSNENTNDYPYVLKDRMERVPMSPWFVHSTHGSLNSAMTKARVLANLIGHENIKIGKVVPLDQYIEIV